MAKFITLGDRDYLIFQALYLHRYLTSGQLYRLVCANTDYHEGSLQRRIRKLVSFKYLGSRKEAVRESNDQFRTLKHYFLEDLSFPIIMDLNQNLLYNQYEFDGQEIILKEFNMTEPTRSVIRGQIDHHYEMQELLIQTIGVLNEQNATRFDDYRYGDGRSYRLNYLGDTLDDQGQEKSIVPDWWFKKLHDDQGVYIELDRGTERPYVLVSKFANYDRHIVQHGHEYKDKPFMLYVHLEVKPFSKYRRIRSMKRSLVGGLKRSLKDRLVLPYVGAGTHSPYGLAQLIQHIDHDSASPKQIQEAVQSLLDEIGHFPLQQIKTAALVNKFNDALPHPTLTFFHDQCIINVMKITPGEIYGEFVVSEWGKVANQMNINTIALFDSKVQLDQETFATFDSNAIAVTYESLKQGIGWEVHVTEGEQPNQLRNIDLKSWLTRGGRLA